MQRAGRPSTFDRVSLAIVALVALVVRIAARPVAPDGWDGVGFVLAVDRFDLAAFQPHPPGYPLFVAAARLLRGLGVSPLSAVVAISIVAGVALPIAGWTLVRRIGGGRLASIVVAVALAIAPGFVTAGAATLSDGAALTLVVATYAACLGDRPTTPLRAGLFAAAAVGVRPIAAIAVFPAAIVFVVRHRDARAITAAIVSAILGVTTWALPTACLVGASRWIALTRTQTEGHLQGWGEPVHRGGVLSMFDAVALQLGGVEGSVAAIVASIAIVASCVALARSRPRALLVAAVALFVGVALAAIQPIDAAPRHALPVACAVLVLAALAFETVVPHADDDPRVVAAAALVALLLVPSCGHAIDAHRSPPAAVAMLRFVAHEPSFESPVVVGGRSSRFTPWGEGAKTTPGNTAGDAIAWATIFASPFPKPLLVTSELDLQGVPEARLTPVATFDRWSPLDRRERSITLYRLTLAPP